MFYLRLHFTLGKYGNWCLYFIDVCEGFQLLTMCNVTEIHFTDINRLVYWCPKQGNVYRTWKNRDYYATVLLLYLFLLCITHLGVIHIHISVHPPPFLHCLELCSPYLGHSLSVCHIMVLGEHYFLPLYGCIVRLRW